MNPNPTIIIGDSRSMSEIKDESVHLVHPPLRVRGDDILFLVETGKSGSPVA